MGGVIGPRDNVFPDPRCGSRRACLDVYYFLSLTLSVRLSVCQSVCRKLQIDSSFLFLDGIEPFFGRQFSMTPSTKRCSSIFDLDLLTPKIDGLYGR